MPNHYHILVWIKAHDIGNKVMQPFGTSYVKAVNKQQKRVGPLYQGPFKARHVDNDGYLSYLTRYIHLNPVRARLVDHPADWPYSSYNDYIGLRHGTLPQTDLILGYFPSRLAYRTCLATTPSWPRPTCKKQPPTHSLKGRTNSGRLGRGVIVKSNYLANGRCLLPHDGKKHGQDGSLNY